MEYLGQFGAGAEKLPNDRLACKAYAGAGLGEYEVAEHGKTGGYAAIGRVGKDGDIK